MDTKIWGIIGGIALLLALLSPFVLSSTKKVERIFEDAEELYEQGQYEVAIAKYNKVLKETKKIGVKIETIDADFIAYVNYKIARCLKLINRVDEALQRYRFIVSQFPNSQWATDSYVDSGDIYFDRKDYKAASEAYKQALDTIVDAERRKQIHQKYQQTLVLINSSKPTPTSELTHLELEEIDTSDFAALTEATSLRFEKRFEEAARQYNVFASNYLPAETAVYALYWAGRCYYEADLFSQSVDAFERLIDDYSYSPNTIEAYHGLAKSYCSWAEKEGGKSNKWPLVIRTIDAAKAKYSTRDTTLNRKFLRLIADIKRKVPDIPKPTPPEEICVSEGRTYFEKDKLVLAEEKAKKALHINKTYQPAHRLLRDIKNEHYARGLEFLDANQYSEAIDPFNKVISIKQYKDSIDSQYKEAYFYLGVAYFNLHNYAYAENAVNEALVIDPEYEEALRLLGEINKSRD